MATIGEIVYHETRHAEQTWQMARMRATMGEDAPTIARTLGIPQDLAEKAVLNKLATNSEEYRAAFRWYESMYGGGRAEREALLRPGGKLETSVHNRDAAQATFERLRNNPASSWEEVEAARQDWITKFNEWQGFDRQYKALPEEQDAYLIGGRAADAYKTATAVPPPPTTVRMPGAPPIPGPTTVRMPGAPPLPSGS
jgi:hypothetical protein